MAQEQRVLWLAPEEIRPNPAQPRRTFSQAELEGLADSIRAHGVLQPLTVRRTEGGWELVAGERRLRAAVLAEQSRVPGRERPAGAPSAAARARGGNLQRQDLHYLEEAEAIAAFLRRSGLTQEAAAEQLGMSPSALANKLRLLRLSPACRAAVTEGGLTERHARCLLRLADEEERLAAARHFVSAGLNVAHAERYVDRRLEVLQSTPPAGRRAYIIKDVRLFLNSVDRGVRLIRDAGVDARAERQETEEDIILTIRIPKRREKRA